MTESNFLYHTSCSSCGSKITLQFTMMDTPIASAVKVTRENELTQPQEKETTGFINYDVNEIASRKIDFNTTQNFNTAQAHTSVGLVKLQTIITLIES